MVLLSLALHLSLALGIVFAHFYSHPSPGLPCAPPKTTLVLIPSLAVPPPPQLAPAKPAVASTAEKPPQAPPPSQPADQKGPLVAAMKTATEPAPASAVEANPNANVPQPKTDALLCPVPSPALNSKEGVVFLLDISGSMYEPYAGSTRLMLARQTLTQHIRALKDGTPFALTVYAQRARNSGPLVAASDATREAAVRFIMEDFDCGGGTNLPAGLASAQELHAGSIILASDGDLNISSWDLRDNARRILGPEGHGPMLTVVGICPRPNTDAESLLQSLADQQGGVYLVEQSDDAARLLTLNKSEVAAP